MDKKVIIVAGFLIVALFIGTAINPAVANPTAIFEADEEASLEEDKKDQDDWKEDDESKEQTDADVEEQYADGAEEDRDEDDGAEEDRDEDDGAEEDRDEDDGAGEDRDEDDGRQEQIDTEEQYDETNLMDILDDIEPDDLLVYDDELLFYEAIGEMHYGNSDDYVLLYLDNNKFAYLMPRLGVAIHCYAFFILNSMSRLRKTIADALI